MNGKIAKRFFNLQLIKLKKFAGVGSLLLLVLNFTFVFYPYVEHRGIHPYVGISITFVFMCIIVLFASHIYIRILGMYIAETSADISYSPTTVWAIAPFQELMFIHSMIPHMKSISFMMPAGEQKQELDKHIGLLEKWAKLGYVPKEDFPAHLKRFYLPKQGERL